MKKFIPLSIFALSFFSCAKDADKVTELESEVMTVHDEVMPRMDEIMTLKSALSKKILKIDSLQNEGISGNDLAASRIAAVDLNQKLNESDKLMMDWMHTYRGDSAKKLKPEQAILYFETEKKKLEGIKLTTVKSINDAKAYLAR